MAQIPIAAAAQTQPYRQVAATHIRELSALSEEVPKLLRESAGAISLLTLRPIPPSPPTQPTERTEQLETATSNLFVQLNSIRVQLKEQIRDLQAQNVIPAEATRFIPPPRVEGQSEEDRERERLKDPESYVTNSGLGSFDIGVLNASAKASGIVGGDEVLARVRLLLQDLVERTEAGGEEKEGLITDG